MHLQVHLPVSWQVPNWEVAILQAGATSTVQLYMACTVDCLCNTQHKLEAADEQGGV